MSEDLEKRVASLEARLEAHKLALSILLGQSSSDSYEHLEAVAKGLVNNDKLKPETLVEIEDLLAVFGQVRKAP